jgi:hypothetical protein
MMEKCSFPGDETNAMKHGLEPLRWKVRLITADSRKLLCDGVNFGINSKIYRQRMP